MKEILIRIGCVLLGVFLTLSTMKIGDFLKARLDSEEVLVEDITITDAAAGNINEEVLVAENVKLYADYEAEAEAKLKELQKRESEAEDGNELNLALESVSANSIEASKLAWNMDYPSVNSEKLLEEKELERSSYEETLATNAFDKKVIESNTIDFSDVVITIMGDSITQGSNLSEEEQKDYAYPVLLQEILNCKEVRSLAIGGSTVSRCGQNAMVDRFDEIGKDSDIIIVFGGSNDCLFQNKWEYGNIEYDLRMNSETFCGDLDELCADIEYEYRTMNDDNYCKLLYINPPSTILNDGVYAIDPGNMVHQKDFALAINTIAPEYQFDVIDLYNNNILNSHDLDVNQQFVPDGIHMNPEGYRILAEHIASQIIQRVKQ